MSEKRNEWKEFEELIANIYRGLHPSAKVTTNEKIPGNESEQDRQIDICIRQMFGVQELLMIVDCKKRSRAVSVPEMQSFVKLKEDVAAHSGVMVNERGFSKGALRIAKKNGVQALTFRDTKKQNWLKCVKIPTLFEFRILMPRRITYQPEGGEEADVDARKLLIDDPVTGTKITLKDVIENHWYTGADMKAGKWLHTYPTVETLGGKPAGTIRHYFVLEKCKYLNKQGADFVGLVDHDKGVAPVSSLETLQFSLAEIERTWKKIDYDAPEPAGYVKGILKTIVGSTTNTGKYLPQMPDFRISLAATMHPEKPLPLTIQPFPE